MTFSFAHGTLMSAKDGKPAVSQSLRETTFHPHCLFTARQRIVPIVQIWAESDTEVPNPSGGSVPAQMLGKTIARAFACLPDVHAQVSEGRRERRPRRPTR